MPYYWTCTKYEECDMYACRRDYNDPRRGPSTKRAPPSASRRRPPLRDGAPKDGADDIVQLYEHVVTSEVVLVHLPFAIALGQRLARADLSVAYFIPRSPWSPSLNTWRRQPPRPRRFSRPASHRIFFRGSGRSSFAVTHTTPHAHTHTSTPLLHPTTAQSNCARQGPEHGGAVSASPRDRVRRGCKLC